MADKPKMATKYPGLYVHSWTKPKRGDPKPAKYRGVYRHKVTVTERAGDGTTTTREEWRTVSKVFDTPLLGEAHALHEEWKAEQAEAEAAKSTALDVPGFVEWRVRVKGESQAIEPSTVRGYQTQCKHIREGFAGVALVDLTSTAVQEWESGLLAGGMAPVGVRKCHVLLKQCMEFAARDGYVRRDPCALVKPPKLPKKPPNALDAAGRNAVRALLVDGAPTPENTAALMALYTGMRRGEVCGLMWRDVDLDAGTIFVSRSIGVGTGGAYEKEPKTGGSRRTIAIPGDLKKALRRRRAAMEADAMRAGVPLEPTTYVIGEFTGGYLSPDTLSGRWATIAHNNGLVGTQGRVVTFHDLRHTYATMAIAEGIDVKTVSSTLGHSSAAMTLDVYASADPKAKRGAATAVNRAMKRKPKKADVLPLHTGTDGE